MFSSWFIKLSPAESRSGGEGALAITVLGIFRLGLVFAAGRRVILCKRKPKVPVLPFPATLSFRPVLSRLSVDPSWGHSLGRRSWLGSWVTRGVWAGLTVSGGPLAHAHHGSTS